MSTSFFLTAQDQPVGRRVVGWIIVAAIAIIAVAAAFELRTDAVRDLALAAVIASTPVALILAFRRPLIFPFALYSALVPFSELVYLPGTGTVTKLVGGFAAAALALYIVRTKRATKPPQAFFGWFALVSWACASMIWAIDPVLSWTLVSILLQLFVLYTLTVLVPATEFEVRAVLTAIAIGGVAAASYGAYTFSQGAQTQYQRLFLTSVTASDTLDPNHFAASLLLPLALVVMTALMTRNIIFKILLLGCIGVIMAGIYASASRGAFIAVGATVLYLLWRSRHRIQVLLVGIVAGIAGLAVPTALWTRITSQDVGSGSGRNAIWTVGFDALKHYWLFGAGAGNFPNAYDESFLRFYEPQMPQWSRAAHDLLLMVGVELGIVGLALLVWVIVSQFKMLNHIAPGHPLHDIRIALEAAFVGMMVDAMVLDVLYWKYAWLLFMAMAITRSATIDTANAPTPSAPAVRPRTRVPRWNGLKVSPVTRA